ncbi:MAG: hypothetical protein H0W02_00185 [Ktedonobacteraceae bacterium]|nr:hypothetical protein [Ktedonobacteraceae bacterium]
MTENTTTVGQHQKTGPVMLSLRELAKRARVASQPTVMAPIVRPAARPAPEEQPTPQLAAVLVATSETDAMRQVPRITLTPTIALIAETVHRYRSTHNGLVPCTVYLHPMRLLSMATADWEAYEVEGGTVQLRTWEGLGIDGAACE